VRAGKMRGRLGILAIATLIIATTAFCACAPAEPPATSEYTPVTIGELIGNTTKYDGQKVEVTGEYINLYPWAQPGCVPVGKNRSPEIREVYHVCPSVWGIYDIDGRIGVAVIASNGVEICNPPNYDKDEEIVLRGIARATTVPDYCFPYIRFRSIYIEVNASDIDITFGQPPSQ